MLPSNPLIQKVMINKRINIVFIICSLFFTTNSLFAVPYWSNHISYSANINQIIKNGNIIFALTDGKLFSYNTDDNSFESYIRNTGGNADIQQIAYSSNNKCMLLVRSDANIEILYEDKSFIDIDGLKIYPLSIDKTINNIFIDGDDAYLSANFGFTIINLKNKEIKESGVFNFPFYSIASFGNKLYASTSRGIYCIDKSKNLIDFNNWELFKINTLYNGTDYPFEDSSIKQLTTFNDKLIFLVPDTAVYYMENESSVRLLVANNELNRIEVTNNNHLLVSSKNSCRDYSSLNDMTKVDISNLKHIISNGNNTMEYWMSSEGNNLSLIKRNNSEGYDFIEDKRWLKPEGPASNYPFSLTLGNNQLIVTGGGYTNINTQRDNRGASLSILKNNRWTNTYSSEISEQSGINSLDLISAISDPADPNHIFAGSWGEGLYEFEGNAFKNRYDKENSPIEEIVVKTENGGYWTTTRVGEMVFDKNSNLWVLNSLVENVIKVYKKNGEWAELYYPEISKTQIETNAKTILIDKYSNKWISSIGGGSPYIFIFNDNGTLIPNDKKKMISTFTDQNGNSLSINAVFDLKEDRQGNMWVATDIGPFTIKGVSSILSSNTIPPLNKIYVEREGNSNALAPLLENIETKVIAIDGANRKWIGTETNGLYLIDSDNSSLEHFTMSNSPLPSDNILSLAIDNQTGVVYIGSARGLVSYKGGATQGADNFSNVYAYPNPVKPDYTGPISITGLKENSSVKITDIKGNLINRGKSLGGQYNWDGLNAKGKRVDTGVYIVFGASEDGSEGVVTKIMVVN